MESRFFPYTRAEALKIVKQYFGLTNKEANTYLNTVLDLADKYINDYATWRAYPGRQIAAMENTLEDQARKAFYND